MFEDVIHDIKEIITVSLRFPKLILQVYVVDSLLLALSKERTARPHVLLLTEVLNVNSFLRNATFDDGLYLSPKEGR